VGRHPSHDVETDGLVTVLRSAGSGLSDKIHNFADQMFYGRFLLILAANWIHHERLEAEGLSVFLPGAIVFSRAATGLSALGRVARRPRTRSWTTGILPVTPL
jgi:hypothetical protein